MTADPSKEQRQGGLIVPWGWLSLGLTIVSIAALGTLAVIAKKQGADSLSTIALALAILSFAAQLIVALAQAYNGTLQVSQAGRVNADTRSSLAEIRATSEALLSNQREQFSEVLHAALKIAVPAAVQDVEISEDSESHIKDTDSGTAEDAVKNLEERLMVRLEEALRPSRTAISSPAPERHRPSPLYDKITTFPDERRGRELVAILNQLKPQEAGLFARFAADMLNRARQGGSPALITRVTKDSMRKLEELGFIKIRKMTAPAGLPERDRLTLTDLGAEVASLILGNGPEPDWLSPLDKPNPDL
jgi:hypothetical protein